MAWSDAAWAVLVALVALFWPAAPLAGVLRLPPLASAALAPPIAVLVLVSSAVAADVSGTRWGWLWVLAVAGLLVAGLALARRLAHRVGRRASVPSPAAPRSPRILGTYLAGIALAALALGPGVLDALVGPTSFAQRYDNVFHLNATHLAASGHASPFNLSPVTHSFYPAAWHDWAALVVQLAGADVRVATHACTLVAVFVVWPVCVAWFVETVLSPGIVGRLVLGPLALSSVSFPLTLAAWGPLYPNLLGLALAPVVLAVGWDLLGRRENPALGLGSGLTLGALAGLAVALAHPNAVLSACLLLLPVAVVSLVDAARHRAPVRGSRVWTVAVGAFVVVFPVVWVVMGRMIAAGSIRDPFTTTRGALIEILTGTSLNRPGVPSLTIGLVAGLLVVAFLPRLRPLLVSFGLASATYFAAAALVTGPGPLLLTAPYYTDPYRIAATCVLLVVPFAVWGWGTAAEALAGRLAPRTQLVAGVALAVALVAATAASDGQRVLRDEVREDHVAPADARVLTPDELALIERLGTTTEPDAVLVVNPYQGGSLAYALADRPVTDYYMNTEPTPAASYLAEHLVDAATDPAVCAAVAETGARYALVLEPFEIPGPLQREPAHPGLEGLAAAPGFERVDAEGDTALYRIAACD